MKTLRIIFLVILCLLQMKIYAQVRDTVQTQKKAALIIGNGNYLSSSLANPENDAKAISEVLRNLGFEVFEFENLNQGQMKKAIDDFGRRIKNYDVGLFFYAGHGIQSKGYNYLIPVDAGLISEAQVEYDCVQADRVLALMEESEAKVKIMILDACRNNPFERSWTRAASGRGLATMNAPSGTLIGYATSPGSTASDGSGKNGLYTSALLESIIIPGISISQMFQNVGRIVSQKSGKQQIPWISSSLTADFYFNPSGDRIPPGQDIQQVNQVSDMTSPGTSSLRKKYPEIKNPDDWMLVEVTENKADVAGMTEVGRIKDSSLWGGVGGNEMALNNCKRNLKKKAAALGCPVVLIIDKKEGMTTSITGIAYK